MKEFPVGDFFSRISRPGEPFDLAVSGLHLANPDPGSILEVFRSIDPVVGGENISHFKDPSFDRKLKAAAKLSGAKRYRVYNRLAFELARDAAPAAAIAWNTSRDFFSARIGCQIYQPVYGIDLAALCLRR